MTTTLVPTKPKQTRQKQVRQNQSLKPTSKARQLRLQKNKETYARQIEQAENRIAENLPEIIESLITTAMGHWEGDKNGDPVFIAGDPKVGMYLVDRIMGRVPTQDVVGGMEIQAGKTVIKVVYEDTGKIAGTPYSEEDED